MIKLSKGVLQIHFRIGRVNERGVCEQLDMFKPNFRVFLNSTILEAAHMLQLIRGTFTYIHLTKTHFFLFKQKQKR